MCLLKIACVSENLGCLRLQLQRGQLAALWDACVVRPLAGSLSRHYPEAEWLHVDEHRHLRFLERHGAIFEDNKGAIRFDGMDWCAF